MKVLAAHGNDDGPRSDKAFCLRLRASGEFWDGTEWAADRDTARFFLAVDDALGVARGNGAGAVDLVVLFSETDRSMTIPLGGG